MATLRMGFVLLLGVSLLTACAPTKSQKQEKAFEKFKADIQAMQSDLPQVVDPTLTLDAVTVEGKSVNYKYTLVADTSLDMNVLMSMQDAVEQTAKNTMCIPDSEPRLALEHGVMVNFYYHYKDGREATVVTVTKDICA